MKCDRIIVERPGYITRTLAASAKLAVFQFEPRSLRHFAQFLVLETVDREHAVTFEAVAFKKRRLICTCTAPGAFDPAKLLQVIDSNSLGCWSWYGRRGKVDDVDR